MAGIMAAAFLVAIRGLTRGVQDDAPDAQTQIQAQHDGQVTGVSGDEPDTDLYPTR
jgi:hypothetical protein